MKKLTKKAFVATIPVLTGYIVLGIGYSMIAKSKGFGAGFAPLMSVFVYAGSMQFAAVDLLSTGASFLTIAFTTLMVNCRHLFYGISMIDKYKGMGVRKPYLIFALTDETYSLAVSQNIEKSEGKDYFFLISLFDHCYWVLGTVLGTVIGSLIHINTEGMDFALTALFVTILVDQWKSADDHIPALVGISASVICLLLFGKESFLIPAMLMILLGLMILKRVKKYG